MLNRLLIGWIVYAGIMGFALGGSFVSAYLMPPPQHQTDADSDENASEQKSKEKTDEALARYTWWLTAFTGGLVLVTGALCIATIGLYITGEKQIEVALKAANAADLSARAAIAIELPVIRAITGKVGWGDEQDSSGRIRHFCYLDYLSFANSGRTKAFPIEVECGWTFGNSLPNVPIYTSKKQFPINTTFDSDMTSFDSDMTSSYDFRVADLTFNVPADAFNRIQDQSAKLWFYCNLIYLDFMQTRHETSFFWRRYQPIGAPGKFFADPIPSYNKKTQTQD